MLQLIEQGTPPNAAALQCDLSRGSLARWLRQGHEEYDRAPVGAEAPKGSCWEFWERVEDAKVVYEATLRSKVVESKDWRAHAWMLKVLNPDKYADSRIIKHQGRVDIAHHAVVDAEVIEVIADILEDDDNGEPLRLVDGGGE